MDCAALAEPVAVTAPTPSVREFRSEDAPRWDAFVERCAKATFFHRIAWRTILEEEFRHRTHYLVAERDGAIVGVLPLAEVKSRWFGHALVSLPFAVYGGPASDEADASRALVDAAEALGRKLGVSRIELRNREPVADGWAKSDLYVTYRKSLEADVEANMLAVPRKQRAMIRKGAKNALASEIDADAGRFFALYADNMHRHGTPPFSRRYFERLLATFGDDCEVLVVVDSNRQPLSGVLSFYFRDEVLPYYAGDTIEARDLAANDFKYWELMRRACDRRVTVFDYGRSKRGTGSFDFKKNWGFEATPLHYEYRLFDGGEIPQHNPLNPKYRALIATWRKLPRPLVNAIGPHLVRNLG
ncbi:MAG TPA: FemAB family XrtA/PEP-CTERM system-associated protein [Casimicrobiaceae bacterium]|nr:FemAB family XrtA/PEP-CTERM system-associated protein [Casimicrobiaceae bacterium]